jgi:predicted lipoprotein with Yx(FWY)xxD motif
MSESRTFVVAPAAIPRSDVDLAPADHLQAIADTAGFHFAFIEQVRAKQPRPILVNPAAARSRRGRKRGGGRMYRESDQRARMEAVAESVGRSRIVAVMLAAALGVVGFLAAGSIARSATQSSATVSLRKTALGMVLVTANGHTLYLFGKDRNGNSACSASCAQFWPPLLSRAKPTAGPGVKASLLGTTKRSDGSLQVTYNKHPLYTYSLDKQAGQTKGEGVFAFGAKWSALSARGAAIIKTPATTTTTGTTKPSPYP